jgi:Notch-like protein
LDKRCNCIPAYDDGVYFDGLFCQLPSTSICYDGKLDGSDQVLFCMQDGTCQDDPTLGCICPAGTGGFSCEFKDPEDCTLDCKNGKCMLGSPSWIATEETYWFNSERVADYQYCLCDDGFTGTLCDTIGGDKCGDGECYNGGTCVSRTIGGVDVEHCDCRTAGNPLANEYYAGTYCQYRATQLCDIGNKADLFCVNNGKCGDRSFEGCDCPDKTAGFSCEFVLDDSVTTSTGGTALGSRHVDTPEDAKCDLDCNGHGTCRHGIKDLDELGIAINANQLSYTHENFQHCVCEPGWTGVFCDTEIKQCNDLSGHFCLHGSTCFTEDNVEKCDCSKATSKIADAFAGDHCEHIADICVKVDDIGSAESYCANNGKCKKYTDVEGTE